MKRLIACAIIAVLVAAIITAGIVNAKNSTENLNALIEQTIMFAKEKNENRLDSAVDNLNTVWQKDKKVLMIYADQHKVDEADRQVIFICALAKNRNDDFVAEAEVCIHLINHIYEIEKFNSKALF